MKKLSSLYLVVCIFVSACSPTWQVVNDKNHRLAWAGMILNIPKGWTYYNDTPPDYKAVINDEPVSIRVKQKLVTKSGFELDLIELSRFSKNMAFPNISKKHLQVNDLPIDWVEQFLAEQRKRLGTKIEVIWSKPVVLSGATGFLVYYQHPNEHSLEFDNLAYGVVYKDYFYTIIYRAQSLHYFQSGQQEFTDMMKSVKFSPK